MLRIILGACALALLGCNKEPGEGGKAEIRGRVLEQRYNANGVPQDQPYPIAEQNVYIIYGDASEGAFPDDNVDTGPDGRFRFKWLRPGTYTIYTMSECEDCASGEEPIYARIELGRKEIGETGDLLIANR